MAISFLNNNLPLIRQIGGTDIQPKFDTSNILDSYNKAKSNQLDLQNKQYINSENAIKLKELSTLNELRKLSAIGSNIKGYLEGFQNVDSAPLPENNKRMVQGLLQTAKQEAQSPDLDLVIDEAINMLNQNQITNLYSAIESLENAAMKYNLNTSNKVYAPQSSSIVGDPAIGDMKVDGSAITESDRAKGKWQGRSTYDPNYKSTTVVWSNPTGTINETRQIEGVKSDSEVDKQKRINELTLKLARGKLTVEEQAELAKYSPNGSKTVANEQEVAVARNKEADKTKIAMVRDDVENVKKYKSALSNLIRVRELAQEFNNTGGIASKISASFARFFGVGEGEGVSAARFNANIGKLIQESAKTLGNNPTDADVKLIAESLPDISNDVTTNLTIIDDHIRMLESKIQALGDAEGALQNMSSSPLPTSGGTTKATPPAAVGSTPVQSKPKLTDYNFDE